MVFGLIAALLPWLLVGTEQVNAFRVPVVFVLTGDAVGLGEVGFSVGLVVLAAAVVGGVAGLAGSARGRRAAGGVLSAMGVLFGARLLEALNELGGAGEFFSAFGPGAYAAILGGAILSLGKRG
jgi:hypothetical protein